MARTSLEEVEAAPAKKAGGGGNAQTGKLILAIGLLVGAGAAFYFFTADAPRPGDSLPPAVVEASSVSASASPTSAPAVSGSSNALSATSGRPPLVTPPVEGSTTTAGPGSRTPGGQP